MRARLAILVLIGLAAHVHAQPVIKEDPQPRDAGYIGGRLIPILEIDDCRQLDPKLTQDQIRAQASEHYQRGETLYLQGDYDGAVTELVAAYCLSPYYTILKDIGQAYERSLEYEKAIGYLERYIAAVPPDARRANDCAADPKEDKANVARRTQVLQNLTAKVYVETDPPDAYITIANDSGTKANGRSRKQIDVLGGRYEMTVERDGYEPSTQVIEVGIGKPYTKYVKLEPLKGTLSVQVSPPDARVFLGKLFVGIGSYQAALPSGTYTISAEAPNRVRHEVQIEVLPGKTHRELVDLAPLPQTGRRQLIVAAGIAGGFAAGGLLYAFQETAIAGAGSVVGVTAGLVGAYFQTPADLPLGTSNLTITSSIAGAIAGYAGARVLTSKDEIIQPVFGASILVGGVVGYYVADRVRITPGDAALFNSAVMWGTGAGLLFSASFDPPRAVSSGLVLSGLGMGAVGGMVLTRYYEISRTHALLIDIGGLIGMAGGIAVSNVASTGDANAEISNERLANFALGGMAVGLIGAGILTRNLDLPKVPVRAAVGSATDSGGNATMTYGLTGTW